MEKFSAMEEISEPKSTLINKNITVLEKRTSIRLEQVLWDSLYDMAQREHCTIHDICSLVHLRKRARTTLTAAIRVFIVLYYRAAVTEEGHRKARHGDFTHMMNRARVRPTNANSYIKRDLKGVFGKENIPLN